MDYYTKTRQELILICKEKGIKGISEKKRRYYKTYRKFS